MARASGIPKAQLRVLDRLTAVRGIGQFYLAGGTGIAFHLHHRRSDDIDLFGPERASFRSFEAFAHASARDVRIVKKGEVTLKLKVSDVPVDVVRYPYPLLEEAAEGPYGFRVAGLLDLATNKLAAISKRGLYRDFWDLYAIAESGITLESAFDAYVRRFGSTESDVYHVKKALVWFEDVGPEMPRQLTATHWRKIQRFFEREVPALVVGTKRRK